MTMFVFVLFVCQSLGVVLKKLNTIVYNKSECFIVLTVFIIFLCVCTAVTVLELVASCVLGVSVCVCAAVFTDE